MKELKTLIGLVTCLLFGVSSFAQTPTSLYNDLKIEYGKLEELDSQSRLFKGINVNDVDETKSKIFEIKQEFKKLHSIQDTPIYHVNNRTLDVNFILLDFYVYEYSTDYYSVIARLKNKGNKYCDWVKLRFNFYQNEQLVGTDFSYIDYESYGWNGTLPYHLSFFETYADKVDFDSVAFEISYYIEDGSGDILWDQILELEACQIIEDTYNRWFGSVKNKSNYSVTFPKIFACIFKDGNMIDLDFTYLDVQNNLLPANTTGIFDSYIDLPEDYDVIKYYLNYSLYSLEGSGNITSNWPVFTQMSYSDTARTNIPFDVFLIDHENDQIQVQLDWGDGSALDWSNSFLSRSVASINHTFIQPGTYYIKAKSKDRPNSESSWSDSLKVEILPVQKLSIITEQLKSGIYQNFYEDTVKAEGGIPPYFWEVNSGSLPSGLFLNLNTGIISGMPTTSGMFEFSLIVTDGGIPSESDTATFSIIINNNPPNLISPDFVSVFEHSELSYTAQAVDPDGNTMLYQFENYPIWLTPSDSTISGTPPEGAQDTSFVVMVSDGELTDTLVVAVTVIPVNDPPQLISPNAVTAYEDSLFEYTARAIDPEGAIITYTFQNYPGWLTPADSTISGIPREGTQDTSFVVIASDGELSDTLMVSIDVIPVNDPPQIINVSDFSFYNHEIYTIDLDSCVTDEDHEATSISWEITPVDENLTIQIMDNTAIFAAPNWIGETEVKFKATDPEGASDSLVVKATVLPPPSDSLIVVATWGAPGSTGNKVPIKLVNTVPVAGVEFTLTDIPNWLTASGANPTPRTSDFSVNTTDNGTEVRVLLFHTGGNLIPTGSGPIVELLYDVDASATAGQTVNLDLHQSIVSDQNSKPIPLVEVDGLFTTGMKGDVVADGTLNIQDIIRLINIILDRPPAPTFYELWAGDCNDDGAHNILDVVLLVNWILHPPAGLAKTNANLAQSAQLSLPTVEVSNAGQIQLPLDATVDGYLSGLQLKIAYDPANVQLFAPQLTERTREMELSYQEMEGEILVLLYSTQGKVIAPGGGSILILSAEVKPDAEGTFPLMLEEAVLATGPAEAVPVQITSGAVTITRPLPEFCELGQNYPNPCNPETAIKYQITEDTQVTLKVYNLLGQEIKTLVNETKKAGYHTVHWDGQDNVGRQVTSGIYLYRIQAGSFVSTRKLAVLR